MKLRTGQRVSPCGRGYWRNVKPDLNGYVFLNKFGSSIMPGRVHINDLVPETTEEAALCNQWCNVTSGIRN